MRALWVLILTPALLAGQARERFEFRGVHLADSLTRKAEADLQLRCQKDAGNVKGVDFCMNQSDHLGDVEVRWFVVVVDRHVMNLQFTYESERFTDISKMLIARWGAPESSQVESVESRMGAKFENVKVKWQLADGALELEKYSSKVTEGRLSIIHDSLALISSHRRACAAASSSSDFGSSARIDAIKARCERE